jgi:hypothetical protein
MSRPSPKNEGLPPLRAQQVIVRKAGETYEIGAGKRQWIQPKKS